MAFPLKYKGRVVILGPKSGPESGAESWPENPPSANHLRANLGPDTGQKLGLNSGRSCGRRGARFRTETSWDLGSSRFRGWDRTRHLVGSVSTFSKAGATYQWYNYVLSRVPAGRTPLPVNLDETPVCLYQGGQAGNIFLAKGIPAVDNESLGKRRQRRRLGTRRALRPIWRQAC